MYLGCSFCITKKKKKKKKKELNEIGLFPSFELFFFQMNLKNVIVYLQTFFAHVVYWDNLSLTTSLADS